MKTETKTLVGCYRNRSTKTSAQKAQAYREEAWEDYLEVKAELERLVTFQRRQDVPKAAITGEQRTIRELQSIFCKGRYRSWRPSSGL
jgi:molecular chaperone GrpE (heat shock protein)